MYLKKTGFAVLFVLLALIGFTQNDTIYTETGIMLVGEIKSLNRNVLTLDADYADSDFKIKWDEVVGVSSNSLLKIYTKKGDRYNGYLAYSDSSERIISVQSIPNNGVVELTDIVEISPLYEKFLKRIEISIDAGLSFSKANNLKQITTNSRLVYKANKWKSDLSFTSVFTDQDEIDKTSRTEGKVSFSYDVFGKAFAFVGMDLLKNSEQKLDLRTTSKVGVGYYFLRTNGMFLQTGIGIANANEKYEGDEQSDENSFEGLGSVEFNAFNIGDFSFRTKVSIFPSFSHAGRIRVNGDASLKWDLPFDFYIKASYTHDFDSKPLAEGVPNNDYVFQTSIGWEFN